MQLLVVGGHGGGHRRRRRLRRLRAHLRLRFVVRRGELRLVLRALPRLLLPRPHRDPRGLPPPRPRHAGVRRARVVAAAGRCSPSRSTSIRPTRPRWPSTAPAGSPRWGSESPAATWSRCFLKTLPTADWRPTVPGGADAAAPGRRIEADPDPGAGQARRHPCDEVDVEPADQLGVLLGQLVERTVLQQQPVVLDPRLVALRAQLLGQPLQRVGFRRCSPPPRAPGRSARPPGSAPHRQRRTPGRRPRPSAPGSG